MIGNDIIDLILAERDSNWKRKGFMDKIFTKNEQYFILNAENSRTMVWNLWSRKEAAYKIYNRQTGIRGYFPLELACLDLENTTEVIFGKVEIKGFLYFTKTLTTSQYINTIAVQNIEDFKAIKILENRKNIQKINGIPYYCKKEKSVSRPISISHHGRFEQIITLIQS